ncbi:MAG: hypothetical protein K1X75_09645 [Leptospirales bacterium]|nr:hypothetical protein [Leptospirales bacterium]
MLHIRILTLSLALALPGALLAKDPDEAPAADEGRVLLNFDRTPGEVRHFRLLSRKTVGRGESSATVESSLRITETVLAAGEESVRLRWTYSQPGGRLWTPGLFSEAFHNALQQKLVGFSVEFELTEDGGIAGPLNQADIDAWAEQAMEGMQQELGAGEEFHRVLNSLNPGNLPFLNGSSAMYLIRSYYLGYLFYLRPLVAEPISLPFENLTGGASIELNGEAILKQDETANLSEITMDLQLSPAGLETMRQTVKDVYERLLRRSLSTAEVMQLQIQFRQRQVFQHRRTNGGEIVRMELTRIREVRVGADLRSQIEENSIQIEPADEAAPIPAPINQRL